MRHTCFWRLSPRLVLAWAALASSVLAVMFTLSWFGRSARAEPEGRARPFALFGADFLEGSPLPPRSGLDRFGCDGRNAAPTLHWTGAPPGTMSFALTMTDHDAPVAGGFHHWVVYNIPAHADTLQGGRHVTQGTNSFGLPGYGGPCPPADGQIHHYLFTLYALTATEPLDEGLTYDELIPKINRHVIAAAVTIGTFTRR